MSLNQTSGKQIRDLSEILAKKAITTSKIYSRNDNNICLGSGGFLTTGDGVIDKRYSNRAKQPKQTFYFNSKNSRMNKTMVNALNKSGTNAATEHTVPSAALPAKRSGSGKAKKPKSGRHASRNNRNVAIYTMAPVMTMTYKKKAKGIK